MQPNHDFDNEFFVTRHLKKKIPTRIELENRQRKLTQFALFNEKKRLDQSFSNYHYCPIPTRNLYESQLIKNSQFKELVQMFEDHNAQIDLCKTKKIVLPTITMPFKCTFHEKLFNLIQELLSFKASKEQLDFLDSIHSWAKENRNLDKPLPKSEAIKISSLVTPTTSAATKCEWKLLADQIEDDRRMYQAGRTWHEGIAPPRDRLMSYQHRQISPMATVPLQTMQEFKKKTFPEKYMKLDDIAKLKYQLENNINTQKEDEGTVEVEMERLRSLSLAPQQKVFMQDNQERDNKLDLTKDFEMQSNQITKQNNNKNLEYSWFQQRNRDISQNREDFEMIFQMNQWSKNRSRIEKEISRRMDVRKFGSSYCNTYQNMIPKDKSKNFHEELGELNQRGRAFSLNTKNQNQTRSYNYSNPQNRSTSPFESHIRNKKMNQVIQNNQALLNLTGQNFNKDKDQDDTVESAQLSAYANKTFFQSRPFSVVIEHQDNHNEQIVEVNEVKSRLAQHRIRVPIKKLMSSLVTPQIERYSQLPEPGFGILDNPLEEKAKPKQTKLGKRSKSTKK